VVFVLTDKRYRYDDIKMGFYGKVFDNGLQANAAGSKPILFPANQNLGRSGRYSSYARFSMLSPFRSLTITLFTSLV